MRLFQSILYLSYGDNITMKKTKIICTLGPATDNPQTLEKMVLSGMDVARFNFSHGAYEDHEKRLKEVIAVREKLNAPIATLLDTKGPEVRLGDFENPDGVVINEGDKFVLQKCALAMKRNVMLIMRDFLVMLKQEQSFLLTMALFQ